MSYGELLAVKGFETKTSEKFNVNHFAITAIYSKE